MSTNKQRGPLPRRKGKHKVKVIFPRTTTTMSSPPPLSKNTLQQRLEELSSDDSGEEEDFSSFTHSPAHETSYYPYNPSNPYDASASQMQPSAPEVFTKLPVLRDTLTTATSIGQDETVGRCLPLLVRLPDVDRDVHIKFLESGLCADEDEGGLPEYFIALDASRPWIVYWCLVGLAELGADVEMYRERVISTLTPLQNSTGGFGGGHGQISHSASTYAAILSLVIVGRDPVTDVEALSMVDRRATYRWLHTLHSATTGGFRVCANGEEDVRGCYTALAVISLLQLPTTDGLLNGTAEYLGKCQSYEGGFGASPGGNEAHGGYAFCALAGLCLLDEPAVILNKHLDLHALVKWLSARQHAPEGGLSGRTNKLVDGCYSTWIGGCWALVEAGLNGPQGDGGNNKITGSLWSREGLARYILACCQHPHGGFRDKPGKGSDFYHTAYILMGLGSVQNYFYYVSQNTGGGGGGGAVASGGSESPVPLPLTAAFLWRFSKDIPTSDGGFETIVPDAPVWPDSGVEGETQRLRVHHPIFNVPFDRVLEVEEWGKKLEGW